MAKRNRGAGSPDPGATPPVPAREGRAGRRTTDVTGRSMTHSPDDVAREAARLLHTGRLADVHEAIRAAAETLGVQGPAGLPRAGRVRQHVRALSMQSLGEAGYAESVRAVLAVAERLMTALEAVLPDARTVLAGRAAEGHVDGGVNLHVRAYTRTPMHELAQAVVDLGYEEPDFDTVRSRYGRLDRMWIEDEGLPIAVTRCPPSREADADRDLVTGRPLTVLTLPQLRAQLE